MRIVIIHRLQKRMGHHTGVLSRAHIDFITAASAERVMKYVAIHRPDVVMLDPSCTGIPMEIKREAAKNEVSPAPFIIMSCPENEPSPREPGVDYFLREPIDIKEIIRVLSVTFKIPLRLSERIPLAIGLSSQMDQTNFPGTTIDISETGMRMSTSKELNRLDRFQCIFRIPGWDDPVTLVCEVMWRQRPVEDAFWQYGVRFVDTPEDCLLKLREYVRFTLESRSD